ncbi:hypothetical protein LPJ66_005865 [Kickxella alabastrina]|uniref:Uncharacterized protein n=1 Tax=Kickxella alabastrina TaxID=61397 RepID=A0ACC1IDH6_9FUNG|nr:hypothetical protein LPJ66_005865 [Kickxella alabastrina]
MSEVINDVVVVKEQARAQAQTQAQGGGWKDFVAGSLAGATQVAIGHPLDTIKVRMQVEGTRVFSGPVDCLTKTVRSEGVLGLYRGMAAPLVGIAAVNSLLFWTYSLGKRLQTGAAGGQATLAQVALAGAGAGAVNSVLASPVELIKVRLQTQRSGGGSGSGGPVQLARQLAAQFGARGLLWGFWATVAREVPAYAAFYSGFEFAKRQLARGSDAKLGAGSLMAAGAFGGVSYWTAGYPLDVIKSRVQNAAAPPARGLGYLAAAARAVYREQGVRGFFRGYSTAVVRSVPAAGATFAVYELVLRELEK